MLLQDEPASDKRSQVPVCRICVAEGVVNSRVVEKAVSHSHHKTKLRRFVCFTCLKRGRETPATCATFTRNQST
jgi:hypothetical protein